MFSVEGFWLRDTNKTQRMFSQSLHSLFLVLGELREEFRDLQLHDGGIPIPR